MILKWSKSNKVHSWKVLRVYYSRGRPPNGRRRKFHIEVLDQSWKDRYLELIMNLLTHDPIIRELGFTSDPVSMQSLKSWIEMHFNQNITLGCILKRDEYDNHNDILVAVDSLYVRHIRDDFPNLTEDDGEAFRNFIKYIKIMERHIRYANAKLNCNFLASFGVYVMPEYVGEIENNMIKVRQCFAKVLDIEYVGGVFARYQSEVLKNHKYRCLKVFHNQEDMDCGLNFSPEVCPIKIAGRSSCRSNHYLEDVMDYVHMKKCKNLRGATKYGTSAGTDDDSDVEELRGFDPQAPQVDLTVGHESIVKEETTDDEQ